MARYGAKVNETIYTMNNTYYGDFDEYVVLSVFKDSPSLTQNNVAIARNKNGLEVRLYLVDCFSEKQMLKFKEKNNF